MLFSQWGKNKTPIRSVSEIQLALDRLKSINPDYFKWVYASNKSIVKLMVYCKTIVDYTELLDKLLGHFKDDLQLYAHQLPHRIEEVYLPEFYTDKQGCYIDPIHATRRFIELAIEFLECYERCEQDTLRDFIIEKNLTLTQHIVNNILILSKELKHVKE